MESYGEVGLMMTLRLEAWKESEFMYLYSAYFDASHNGQLSGGTFAVAGWLATGEQWASFGSDWRCVLEEFNVPYMHMKEFAHFRGPFAEGWKDENKRIAFLARLNDVVCCHRTASFLCVVSRADFEAVNCGSRLREYFGNEFALCSMTCVQQVYRWLAEQGRLPSADCIFEDGDERGNLTSLMESRGYPSPVYRPKHDKQTPVGIIPGMIPLQVADMLAYESRLNYDRYEEDHPEMFRKSFLKLAESADHKGFWAKVKREELEVIASNLGLSR